MNVLLLEERWDGGGGKGELAARTRKGTDLTHYQLSARAIPSSSPPSLHLSTTLPSLLSRQQVTSQRSKRPRVEAPAPSSSQPAVSYRDQC